jgi:hypothetical protein
MKAITLAGAAAIALLALSGVAMAQQDPSTGGQLNKCWGKIASATAQLTVNDPNIKGGAMGAHVRSSQGADRVGGFASTTNDFPVNFNEDGGRLGVGGATRSFPHFEEPGDGGIGQHAINNGVGDNGLGLANTFDPVTGNRIATQDPSTTTGGLDTLVCDPA